MNRIVTILLASLLTVACARERIDAAQVPRPVTPTPATPAAAPAPHEMSMASSDPVPDAGAPVLLPVMLTNAAAMDAYTKAAQIPDRLSKMYCYCHCHEERGHASLLTCFQTSHAEECQVCQHEAVQAWMDWQTGMPVEGSQKAADVAFNSGNPPPAS